MQIGAATVAKPNTATPEQSDIDPDTLRTLTFNGPATASMNKGAELLSDPVNLPVADLERPGGQPLLPGPRPARPPSTAQSLQENFVGPGRT